MIATMSDRARGGSDGGGGWEGGEEEGRDEDVVVDGVDDGLGEDESDEARASLIISSTEATS